MEQRMVTLIKSALAEGWKTTAAIPRKNQSTSLVNREVTANRKMFELTIWQTLSELS
jgi:hypothetical protein